MYQGSSIDVPCGRGGLNGNINSYLIPPTDLVTARNIRYDGFVWRKAPGLSLFDASAIAGAPTCFAGFDWRPESGSQHQVTVWSNGNIYKESGGDIDAATAQSGLTITNPVVLLEGGDIIAGADRELYFYSKGNAPKKLVGTGASFAAFTSESADWATNKPGAAVYHDFRIVAFDVDSAPHNLYFSTLTNHTDFTGGGAKVASVAPGVGDRITAAFSYLPSQFFVFKYPRGIWSVDTSDLTLTTLPTTLIREDVGVAGPHCVTKVGGDIWFISANGRLYSMSALRPDTDLVDADITARLNLTTFIRDNVDATKLRFARLVYDESRKELWYIYTRAGSGVTVNDSALVFDLNEPGTIKAAHEDRGPYFHAMWRRVASSGIYAGFNELLAAGSGGLVYRANQVNRSIGASTAYIAELKTPDYDFRAVDPALADKEKLYSMLEVSVIPTGSYTMEFDIFIDGMLRKTVSTSLSGGESVFDDAEFDSDVFGGLTIVKKRMQLDLIGNQIAVKASNSNLNEDFGLINLRCYFKVQNQEYEE